MVLFWVIAWLASAAGAYLILEAAALAIGRQYWDKTLRRFSLVSGLVLGPVMLAIGLELLLLAEVGRGIATIKGWRYKD